MLQFAIFSAVWDLKTFQPHTTVKKVESQICQNVKNFWEYSVWMKTGKPLGWKLLVQIGKESLEEKGQAHSIFYCFSFPVFYSDNSLFLYILNILSINFFFPLCFLRKHAYEHAYFPPTSSSGYKNIITPCISQLAFVQPFLWSKQEQGSEKSMEVGASRKRDHSSRDSPVLYPNPEVIELPLAMVLVLLLVPFLLPAKLLQLADAVRQQEVRRQAVLCIHLLWLQGRRRQWHLLRKLDRGQGCHRGSLQGWACLCHPWAAKHNV